MVGGGVDDEVIIVPEGRLDGEFFSDGGNRLESWVGDVD